MRRLLLWMAVLVGGCLPTFAPPARLAHHGAPGKGRADTVELAGAVSDSAAIGGEFDAALAVTERTELEVGALFIRDYLTMGFIGLRFAPLRAADGRGGLRPTMDVETGMGVGRGGRRCYKETEVCDDIDWTRRGAIGGYGGLGLGLNARWFDMFVRGRYQMATAQNVPLTHWLSAVAGMQFTVFERARFYAAGGAARYDNPEDAAWWFLWEAGFGVCFNR